MVSSKTVAFLQRSIKPIILLTVIILHVVALLFIRFNSMPQDQEKGEEYEILKLVDIEEFIPPPPPPKEEIKEVIPEETVQVDSSETVVVTEEDIVEVVDDLSIPAQGINEIEYFPQHKISTVPVIPTKEILEKIVYPAMALRQGIEGVVYLELYIDRYGTIRKIEVLKDPGHGFAEAALSALKDIVCMPATANGEPVAVRFRYPVRFILN